MSRKYLNAGVLLFDCASYIDRKIELKTTRLAHTTPLWLYDQSALNTVLGGNWLELSQAFNMSARTRDSYVSRVFDPVVVHFMGPSKPWHGPESQVSHPMSRELQQFLQNSPWSSRWLTGAGAPRPPRAQSSGSQPPAVETPEFIEYLTTTTFADVAAGITDARFEHLPGSTGSA